MISMVLRILAIRREAKADIIVHENVIKILCCPIHGVLVKVIPARVPMSFLSNEGTRYVWVVVAGSIFLCNTKREHRSYMLFHFQFRVLLEDVLEGN